MSSNTRIALKPCIKLPALLQAAFSTEFDVQDLDDVERNQKGLADTNCLVLSPSEQPNLSQRPPNTQRGMAGHKKTE